MTRRRPDWWFWAAIVGPAILVLGFGGVLLWLEPRCLRDHVEQRWVEYYCETVEVSSIDVEGMHLPIYGTQCHDAHWEPVTVCDQWEVERP